MQTLAKIAEPRMVPVAFGNCAGWLHPAAGRHGVILCGALNHESLPLHQSWHVLAAMIAEAGLPALRFDYSGTGDSLGCDCDPRRVQDWLASVSAAARWMREKGGVETISLVGIRLGATLAGLSAAQIGADRLALIAPVMSGRAYVREIQARSNMLAGMWRLSETTCASDAIASDGFTITRETITDLSRIDLAQLVEAPARDVLLVNERAGPAAIKLADKLAALGCAVSETTFPRFGETAASATLARIPHEEWQSVVAFLTQSRAARNPSPFLPAASTPLAAPTFREERMIFGADDRLAGVLCRPAAGHSSATLVFVNTGGNAHIGWGRMFVEHARALAARGIASLRMDIAGLGDATWFADGPRAALYSKASISDLREAIDLLEARGLGNVAVVGHCGGAWLALNGALADKRIRRLFLVNLQRFIWTGQENLEELMAKTYRAADSYLKEIGSGTIWRRVLKGDINWPRLPGIAASMLRGAAARVTNRIWPPLAPLLGIETETARITHMLAQLAGRGTDTLLVYSDTDPGRDELARHFGPSGCRLSVPRARIAIIEDADHDITSEEARAAYFDLLLDHLGRCGQPSHRAEVGDGQQTIVAEAA
ncbi:MAG: alpha/beta hydrolase [Beijerinckiaceae bacterium]